MKTGHQAVRKGGTVELIDQEKNFIWQKDENKFLPPTKHKSQLHIDEGF